MSLSSLSRCCKCSRHALTKQTSNIVCFLFQDSFPPELYSVQGCLLSRDSNMGPWGSIFRITSSFDSCPAGPGPPGLTLAPKFIQVPCVSMPGVLASACRITGFAKRRMPGALGGASACGLDLRSPNSSF